MKRALTLSSDSAVQPSKKYSYFFYDEQYQASPLVSVFLPAPLSEDAFFPHEIIVQEMWTKYMSASSFIALSLTCRKFRERALKCCDEPSDPSQHILRDLLAPIVELRRVLRTIQLTVPHNVYFTVDPRWIPTRSTHPDRADSRERTALLAALHLAKGRSFSNSAFNQHRRLYGSLTACFQLEYGIDRDTALKKVALTFCCAEAKMLPYLFEKEALSPTFEVATPCIFDWEPVRTKIMTITFLTGAMSSTIRRMPVETLGRLCLALTKEQWEQAKFGPIKTVATQVARCRMVADTSSVPATVLYDQFCAHMKAGQHWLVADLEFAFRNSFSNDCYTEAFTSLYRDRCYEFLKYAAIAFERVSHAHYPVLIPLLGEAIEEKNWTYIEALDVATKKQPSLRFLLVKRALKHKAFEQAAMFWDRFLDGLGPFRYFNLLHMLGNPLHTDSLQSILFLYKRIKRSLNLPEDKAEQDCIVVDANKKHIVLEELLMGACASGNATLIRQLITHFDDYFSSLKQGTLIYLLTCGQRCQNPIAFFNAAADLATHLGLPQAFGSARFQTFLRNEVKKARGDLLLNFLYTLNYRMPETVVEQAIFAKRTGGLSLIIRHHDHLERDGTRVKPRLLAASNAVVEKIKQDGSPGKADQQILEILTLWKPGAFQTAETQWIDLLV